jgi:hypothetical protein
MLFPCGLKDYFKSMRVTLDAQLEALATKGLVAMFNGV